MERMKRLWLLECVCYWYTWQQCFIRRLRAKWESLIRYGRNWADHVSIVPWSKPWKSWLFFARSARVFANYHGNYRRLEIKKKKTNCRWHAHPFSVHSFEVQNCCEIDFFELFLTNNSKTLTYRKSDKRQFCRILLLTMLRHINKL